MRRFICVLLCGVSVVLALKARVTAADFVINDGEIYVLGEIEPGDSKKFEAAVRQVGPDVGLIRLRSPGGRVDEALTIGRLIRRLYLSTEAPFDAKIAPAVSPNCGADKRALHREIQCTCASACFLVWTAGVMRSGTELFLHRIAFDKQYFGSLSPDEAAAKYQQAFNGVRQYLQDMDMPDLYYAKMLKIPSFAAVKLDYYESNALGQPPGFAEWLTARCGGFTEKMTIAERGKLGQCYWNEQVNAKHSAVNKWMIETAPN